MKTQKSESFQRSGGFQICTSGLQTALKFPGLCLHTSPTSFRSRHPRNRCIRERESVKHHQSLLLQKPPSKGWMWMVELPWTTAHVTGMVRRDASVHPSKVARWYLRKGRWQHRQVVISITRASHVGALYVVKSSLLSDFKIASINGTRLEWWSTKW